MIIFKRIFLVLIFILMTEELISQTSFKDSQMKYERVKTAYKEKEKTVKKNLETYNINLKKLEILLIAYKKEKKLQLWAKEKGKDVYQKIQTYNFSAFSGELGPKRKQGDYQIPEGFYFIERFNPMSNFYLSLGINYPNQSDKKKSRTKDLGGDVFIHGDNVTIGCIPITDEKIKELYLYAVEARNNGQQKINVAIFPSELDDKGFKKLQNDYASEKKLLNFWSNLKEVYDYFQSKKQFPKISVDENGDYIYK